MAIQPAVCTQCGGKLNVDDIDLNGFCDCEYCGSHHKVIDIITIDGLPTVKSLLTNAEFNLQDGKLEEAEKLYKEVIKIKPNCHEAWWGQFLCNAAYDRYYGYQDKYGNSGPQVKANIMENTIIKYANRAIEYAPPEDKEKYKKEIEGQLVEIDAIRHPVTNVKNKGISIVDKIKNILKK